MPEVSDLKNADIAVIYTEIGRGHPSYLDGIVAMLETKNPEINIYKNDVFNMSQGLCLIGWRLVRALYKVGATGGLVSKMYYLLRHGAKTAGSHRFARKILGTSIRQKLNGLDIPVVVAHPLLVAVLSDQNKVIYQHGELVVPAESLVRNCYRVFVPTTDAARGFTAMGYSADELFISGQCIETLLTPFAEQAYRKRIERIKGSQPLTAALFTSGAYPPTHLKRLLIIARYLYETGCKIFFFLGQSDQVTRKFRFYLKRNGISAGSKIDGDEQIIIVETLSRGDENHKIANLWESLDFFVAPAHERTNWAVGLGIPMFILCPHIGSYAQRNARLAVDHGVAFEIENDGYAKSLAKTIADLRSGGDLLKMAEHGFHPESIMGFDRCGEYLLKLISRDN